MAILRLSRSTQHDCLLSYVRRVIHKRLIASSFETPPLAGPVAEESTRPAVVFRT